MVSQIKGQWATNHRPTYTTMQNYIIKETKLFLRDDFTFNPNTEIGLDVTPAQGFIKPKWHEFEVALEGEQPMQHDGVLGEWVESEGV